MTESKPKKDRAPIRVTPEIKKQIGLEAVNFGLYEYEVIERAWAAYKSRDVKAELPPTPAASKVPAAHQALVDKLVNVLSSGDELATDALTQNINFFYERQRPTVKPKRIDRKTG